MGNPSAPTTSYVGKSNKNPIKQASSKSKIKAAAKKAAKRK